jgi:IS30 family transposase
MELFMRGYRRLTREDRIAIEKGLEKGKKQIEIAEQLGFNRSTICREISKNKAEYGPYRWRGAQAKSVVRRKPLFDYERKIKGPLEELITAWILNGLSPEQVSNRLKLEGAQWSVSHETIYKWIYKIQTGLIPYLRWKPRKRQRRGGGCRRSIQPIAKKMIESRPSAANERSEQGHWERDLLLGTRSGPALLVIQDRKTRLTLLKKVVNKTTLEVNRATIEALKGQMVLSTTNDNGTEFSDYKPLEAALKTEIYFCHPYTSSERGTVENTNGLIRQYFPKGYDFSRTSEAEIKVIEDLINKRPKKVLGYLSPWEVHHQRRLKMVLSERSYRYRAIERARATFINDMQMALGDDFKSEMFVAINN